MSDKNLSRRASVQLNFAGSDITKNITPYLLSMSYTDNEEDEADDLQITLQDREGIWQEKWLKDAVEASLSEAKQVTKTEAAETTTSKKCRVTATAGLNVRSAPSTSASRLGVLSYNATVTVMGTSGSWSIIQYSGKKAYVYSAYLKEVSSETSKSKSDEKDEKEEDVPNPGMQIQAVIVAQNWSGDGKDQMLECGQFELDAVDSSGPPAVVTIKATALPYSASIRQTKKSRAWEQYNLRDIAKEISRKNGLSYLYSSSANPTYDRLEQVKESDIEFLSRLCHKNGISLKTTNNILVLFDQASYERKNASYTIKREKSPYSKYKFSIGKSNTQYTSCRVSYTNPATGKCIEGIVKVADYDEKSKNNQQLEVTSKVSSVSEARRIAEKLLRQQNKYAQTATFTLAGDPTLIAGKTVNVSGFGYFDGKYIAAKVKHSVSGSGGYTTQLTLRKILVGDIEPEEEPKTGKKKTYKVGDIVQFKGGNHYVSSMASGSSGYCKAGPAKITLHASGAKHPWHLIHTNSQSWVYGWVDEDTFE